MLILEKKKIILVFFIVIVVVIILLYINIIKFNMYIETTNEPNKMKIVVLDAGHGFPDGGAVSDEGVREADINLIITLKVKELLKKEGKEVVLTRTDEKGIYNKEANTIREQKVSDIKNRVKIGNESNADIFVSIHLNKIPQKKYWGWQTFFKEGNEQSKKLAEQIQEGLNETIEKENKRQSLKIKNIYIIENVKIPTTIVECGFLSNEEEKKLLQTEEYQNKIAEGICKGINNYLQ